MKKNISVILIISVLIGSAINVFAGINGSSKTQDKVKIGLLSFTGETSKVDQNSVRVAMAERLNSKGFLATTSSGDERERAKNKYFIGVEVKSTGKSGFTVIITLYGKDKSVIRQVSKSGGTNDGRDRTAGGGSDDSIRPMVLNGLEELASVIR